MSTRLVILLTLAFEICAISRGLANDAVQASGIPDIVKIHCSGCHNPPRAGSMTQDAWIPTINNMVKTMQERRFQPIPTQSGLNQIIDYYIRHSPIEYEQIPDDLEETKLEFEKMAVGELPVTERPQVSNLKVCDLDSDGSEDDVIVCDNVNSTVSWLRLGDDGSTWKETVLANVPAPVRTTILDFDQDGDLDIAVSAMGVMYPSDDLIGEFHLLLNRGDETFEQLILLKGTPRITDIAAEDFDGDGDLDFVIAMFGWRTTGRLSYLEQTRPRGFVEKKIMEINGVMRIEPIDLNGDNQLDFITLIAQEHETVGGFINQGGGKFRDTVLARANHPVFGSSGIELVDLDEDGDLDLIYTNGDMMDENPQPKPFHGVRWLENMNGKWELRHLASMPGCYCSNTTDMDGDGDPDIVVSALYFHWDQHDFPSLIWLENQGGAKGFVRRRIAYAPSNLASSAVGDLNNDGLPDIVGGGMHVPGPIDRKGRLTVWLQKKNPGGAIE